MSEAVAALDIGGSHVSAARIDMRVGATEPGTTRRVSYRPDAGRELLLDAIVAAAASVAAGVELIGVATPGPFDYERGVFKVTGLAKLESLYDVDLGQELAAALGRGTSIAFVNDAEAFLLGEIWMGAARGYPRAVGVTLGTGLGSAFALGGGIVADGPSVPSEGSLHLVPFRGMPVEDVVSTRGLLARSKTQAADVAQLADNAHDGDADAVRLFAQLGRDLGEFLAPWLGGFGAQCLVVGGSIANAWALFGPALGHSLGDLPELELVARAANIDDAPLLGAAFHAATRTRRLRA